MIRFIKKLCKNNRFPILWTILSIVLLCIPGSSIPGFGLFGIKHLDKLAHIILFGGIVFSWSAFAILNGGLSNKTMIFTFLITIGSVALGIIMEFIQFNFIPNRLFDIEDIWANFAGSLLALGLVRIMRRKLLPN